MAASLVRQHHGFDPLRFFMPQDVEQGYLWWFGQEMQNPKAALWVAIHDVEPCGYAYARLEPRDFNALLDACCMLHDIWVEEPLRQYGVARALMEAVGGFVRDHKAPRLVLFTAKANAGAQAFFASLGCRPTMVEMTLETKAP